MYSWEVFNSKTNERHKGSAPSRSEAQDAAYAKKMELGYKGMVASVTSPKGVTWHCRSYERRSGDGWFK